MKVWTYVGFIGHWPTGTAAVVVAPDEGTAASILNTKLIQIGLKPTAESGKFSKLNTGHPHAVVLVDGNY
jgi:hypothetical protein